MKYLWILQTFIFSSSFIILSISAQVTAVEDQTVDHGSFCDTKLENKAPKVTVSSSSTVEVVDPVISFSEKLEQEETQIKTDVEQVEEKGIQHQYENSNAKGRREDENILNDEFVRTITKEIEATEELISALTKKVNLLEKSRQYALLGKLTQEGISKLGENVGMKEHESKSPTTAPGLLKATPLRVDNSRDFGEFFAERSSIATSLGDRIVKSGVINLKSRRGGRARAQARPDAIFEQPSIIAIVSSSGNVKFSDVDGNVISAFQTGLPLPIKQANILNSHLPVVALGDSTGEVTLFNVSVYLHTHRVLGAGPSRFNTSQVGVEDHSLPPEHPRKVHGPTSAVAVTLQRSSTMLFENTLRAPLTSMAVVDSRKGPIVCTGDANGEVTLFQRNGTVIHTLKMDSKVNSLAANLHGLIAVSAGDRVSVLAVQQLNRPALSCRGVLHQTIVSLAFDVLSSNAFYAGTDKGEVIVFAKRRGHGGQQNVQTCALIHKITPQVLAMASPNLAEEVADGVPALPVMVAPLRGYLASTVGNVVVIHNTTDVLHSSPEFVSAKSFGRVGFPQEGTMDLASVALGVGRSAAMCLLFQVRQDDNSSSLLMMESLLPWDPPVNDFGWIRGPIIGVSLIGVILWQVLKQRPGDKPFLGGSNVPPSMNNEFEAMMQRMGAGGRGGRRSNPMGPRTSRSHQTDWRRDYGDGDNFNVAKFVRDFETMH